AAFDEPRINIPGFRGSTLGSRYDWNFTSIPQANARNGVFGYNRGRVLGGSSALNLMSYDRAAVSEYDSWEDLGNDGWNGDNLIGALMRSGTFTNPGGYREDGVGDNGPVQALINRFIPEHHDA